MKEFASDSYVKEALGILIDDIGVKDEIDLSKLEALFHEKDINLGVQSIALQLGLPVIITLEYGEKNIQSEGLARTDTNGRGIEGIVAQVRIPAYLPRFGTSELRSYPVKIFIGADYRNQIAALMTVLVHELSHILLHSMRYPYCQDEIYTDLVGPVLGMTAVVEKGRKTIKTEYQGDRILTQTTTYGYLSDNQFNQAKQEISEVLQAKKCTDIAAKAEISELGRLCISAKQQIERFRRDLEKLDSYPKNTISEGDAIRLVSFHQPGYLDDFSKVLQDCEQYIELATSFFELSRHYTKKRTVEFEGLRERTRLAAADVLSKSANLNKDIGLIKRGMKLRAKFLG
jgi:hypothetical protein